MANVKCVCICVRVFNWSTCEIALFFTKELKKQTKKTSFFHYSGKRLLIERSLLWRNRTSRRYCCVTIRTAS
jgi:hypothetical protein